MAYLNKQQVIADFKVNYIPHLDTDELKRKAWGIYLTQLCKDRRISEKQKDIWVFPKDL